MKIFGLIGEKLSHSFSPLIHQYIYQRLGIDAAYHLFEVQPHLLPAAIEGLRALNISGVNVTIPYKIHTMEHLDQISPEAAAIGSVNTIRNDQGSLAGYNTDYFGFQRTLAHYGIPIKGKRALVLGNGGAAKAVVATLKGCEASEILMLARDPHGVAGFEGRVSGILPYEQISQAGHCDLLVNCTPVGMYPNQEASLLSMDHLTQFDCVLDLIYNPMSTKLMKEAAQLGLPAYNGLYMLVAQAAAAIELWNSVTVEDPILQDTYLHLQQQFAK